MSDSSLTLSCSVNGTTYTTNINNALSAINSMRSGTSAPTNNIVDGTLWLDNSSSDNKIKIRIGSTWHTLSDFDGSNFYFEYAKKATQLETARTIGGVSFNGTENINLPGVNTTGNQNTSGSAAKLTTARTVTLTGDVSGSTTFDGESDVSITATVADDSHNHVVGNLDNFTEEVQDIIGGMVTGNTESNITVTYEDGDGTLDFSVPTPDITGTSLGGVLGGTVGNATIDADSIGDSQLNAGGALADGKILTGTDGSSFQWEDPAPSGTVVSAGARTVVATGNRMIATFSAGGGDSSRSTNGTNSNSGGDGAGIQGAIYTVSSGETITVTIPAKGGGAANNSKGQDGVSVTVTGSTAGSIATFGGGTGGGTSGTGTSAVTNGTSSGSSANGRNYPGKGGEFIATHNAFNAGDPATALIHGFFTA